MNFLIPAVEWDVVLDMLIHFATLSLLATGGAISLAPDMHRYIVDEMHLLTDAQFTSSIAIAQAAPGPNLLFVTVMGWQVAGAWGALATTIGVLTPSALLVLAVGRYSESRADSVWVKAMKEGLAPVVIALTLSAAYVLAEHWFDNWKVMALVVLVMLITTLTRLHPVLMIAVGAVLGVAGVI